MAAASIGSPTRVPPFRILRQARCTAVSEDEQAVSTMKLGPRKSDA